MIPSPKLAFISLEDMIASRRLQVLIQEHLIECEIQLKNRKMLKIFFNTLYREDFFFEGTVADLFGSV